MEISRVIYKELRLIPAILVLLKDISQGQIDQLKLIFDITRHGWLKVNTKSWRLKEFPSPGYVLNLEGVKPDTEKVKGITDLGISTTITEAKQLIGMLYDNRHMRLRILHVLVLMTEVSSRYKCRKLIWNNEIEVSFKELKRIVSTYTLLNYLYRKNYIHSIY